MMNPFQTIAILFADAYPYVYLYIVIVQRCCCSDHNHNNNNNKNNNLSGSQKNISHRSAVNFLTYSDRLHRASYASQGWCVP